MHNVFLGGPIQYLARDPLVFVQMKNLVREFSHLISSRGAEVFNAHIVEKFGDESYKWSPKSIAARDFEWMMRCDTFVAFFPSDSDGKFARSDGTHIELGWASALSKRVFLVGERTALCECSDLLKGLVETGGVRMFPLETAVIDPQSLVSMILEPDRVVGSAGFCDLSRAG